MMMTWVGCLLAVCGAGKADLDADIVARSVVDMGNTARLQCVMAKARRGEPVTIGVIGGSITQGALASAPEKCWGALTADWWRAAFPKAQVTFVNAGIGATCSDLGAHRVGSHLLSKKPDVVVVEYAVNDAINPLAAETLEGLLRQILCTPNTPAVILFFTMGKDGNSRQEEHVRVGRHYGLPMASLKDALWPEVQSGRIPWTDFEADDVHPNDLGHHYSAQLIGGLLDRVKVALAPDDQSIATIPPIPAPLISDLFEHTQLYNAASITPSRNEGWEKTAEDPFFGAGWKAIQPGSVIEFEIEGKAVSLLTWRIKGPMGRAEAWVDNGQPIKLEGWFDATWGGFMPFQLMARDLNPGKHTLHVRLLEERDAQSTGNAFQIHAVMSAGLARP